MLRVLPVASLVSAIEYGLIASLIGVAIIVSVTAVGTGLNNTFNNVKNKL